MTETTGDSEQMLLRPNIVLYADILGFTASTVKAFKSQTQEAFLQKIKNSIGRAYDEVLDASKSHGMPRPLFHTKMFADNIVVAYPIRNLKEDGGEAELGNLLMLFANVQARLARDGFFLRGAIAAGEHYQDHFIVFGDAFLEAYNLDKSGGPRRLVIAPSVERLISLHLSWYAPDTAPHYHYLLEDPNDRLLFVNYLGVANEHFPWRKIDHELLAAHGQQALKNLSMYEFDYRVGPKYEWVATYHNYVCKDVASLVVDTIDESAAPREIEAWRDAKRALNHTLDFERQKTVKAPQRLDAQRLRHRVSSEKDPIVMRP